MPSTPTIFLLATMLGLAFSAQAADYPACGPRTLSTYALLGPVKSVRVEQSSADGRRVLLEREVFDRSGRLLEDRNQITVGDSPEHIGYQVFRNIYQPLGRDFKINMFEIDPAQGEKPIDLQRHIVKFDSLSRCIEERNIDSDGKFNGKQTYEYDASGDLIREIDYNFDETVLSRQERTYNSDHKLLSESEIDDPGQNSTPHWSRRYQYDAQGNQTDIFSFREGVPEAHWISKYDERNRLISSQCIVADPQKDQQVYGRCSDCGLSSGETTYKYDDAGRIIEERMFQPGKKLVSVSANVYDAHGNRLTSPDSTYLYDPHGNWINEVSPGRTSNSIYRVINYY